MYICLGLGLFSALIISLEDFRRRSIHLIVLLIFLMSGWSFQALRQSIWIPVHIYTNTAIMLVVWLSIKLFYRWKGRGRIMDHALGWGDVVMLLALGCWMDTHVFLAYYAASSFLFSLIFLLLIALKRIPHDYPIPLAGLFGLTFVISFPLILFFHV